MADPHEGAAHVNTRSDISMEGHTEAEHADPNPLCATFGKEGVCTVVAGTLRFYVKGAWTITQVRASVGTAPTGASLIVDCNKNGTTVFTTQSNRPTIAASGFTDLADAINVTALADGDYLTVDVDQIGSSVAGSNLTVQVWMVRA